MVVSRGNTGALVGASKLLLPNIANITRPALIVDIPTSKNTLSVLDVGANSTSNPNFLMQWAKLGIAYKKTLGLKNPRLGILNIGPAATNGNNFIRAVYQQLCKSKCFNFKGNIEGHNALNGFVDILLTDGFLGNIFLKATEGTIKFILKMAKKLDSIKSENISRFFDKNKNQGALLLGVKKPVLKCHRYASYKSICNAIEKGIHWLDNDLFNQLEEHTLSLFK